MLRICLLGHFEVSMEGTGVDLDSRPVQALLAYLALNSHAAQSREELAGALWPESDETNARANLRHALWRLRQAIGDDYLDVSKASLRLDPDTEWTLDVSQLEDAEPGSASVDTLLDAVALYKGPLLPGFYEEWADRERSRIEALFQSRIQSLIEGLTDSERWADVIIWSEDWIALGHSPEPAYRALMQAHAALGDAAAMANAYQRCRQALMDDLGVEPSPETEHLYRRLASGERPQGRAAEIRLSEPTSARPHSNLPAATSQFFGRQEELEFLTELLQDENVRLVTLTGPAGIGKTRLALEAASRLQPAYSDGAWFSDFAPLDDPALVPSSIATDLNVKSHGDQPILSALEAHLAHRQMLLVLDNFEHIVAAAPVVSQLLSAAPELRVLATSQARLRLQGENDFPVAPLPVPDQMTTDPQTLMQIDAVRLFDDRARSVDPSFRMTDENAGAVARICRRLEGLPLAIELAAARVSLFPAEVLVDRLETRLGALTAGRRDAPKRQQTLRGALEWSYELLNEAEGQLFNRLGIFSGGWAIEQADAVCQPDLEVDIVEGLGSLLDQSFITREKSAQPRYGMLETLREFALEKLRSSDSYESIGERHAEAYANLVQASKAAIEPVASMDWIRRLEAEKDNVRAALRWMGHGERRLDLALRLVSDITPFWVLRGYLSEGYAHATAVLEHAGPGDDPKLLLSTSLAAGRLAYRQNSLDDAGRHFEAALELAQKVGDPLRTAEALEGLGNVATEVGDYVSAPERIRQAQALYRQANDADGIAGSDMNLAWAFMRNGDPETAETHLLEALEIFESSGSQPGLGFCLSGLGEAYLRQAKLEQALQALQRSLEIRESLGDKWGTAATLGSLAWAYLETGDLPAAERALKRSLWLRRETGDKGGMAWCLEKLAETLAPAKRSASAVYLYAAAFALRESIHSVIDPADQPAHEARIAALRQSLGQTDFEAEWKRGLSSPREAVIDGILAETPPGV